MACTTILVGKKASLDGSTIIARNEDCGSGQINEKKFSVVLPDEQPKHYTSKCSGLSLELTAKPMRYTCTPDAVNRIGYWAEAGVNEAQVSMSATETTTTNPRVLGADPYVEKVHAVGKEEDANYKAEVPGGIGEEDFVTLVLPYAKSPRDAVRLLGSLLEEYGTYESNGVAFSDADEIWWMETIGGHHWIAKRVPDDQYVIMPNQFGIDSFDLADAFGKQKDHMCSADLYDFMCENHLSRNVGKKDTFNPRPVFGSRSDSDHVYNTPRAWDMMRWLSPNAGTYFGENADFTPESDNLPWSLKADNYISIEDVKYVLGLHYQGTEYNPYGKHENANKYRSIGINRNCELSILQMRGYAPKKTCAIQWLSLGCNVFNCLVPLYTEIEKAPEYVGNTTARVTTDSMYWTNRIIAALADAHFNKTSHLIESYQLQMQSYANARIKEIDASITGLKGSDLHRALEQENEITCEHIRKKTDELLSKVLFVAYDHMKNAYSMNDK